MHTYVSVRFPLRRRRKALGPCCISTDITERKQSEEPCEEVKATNAFGNDGGDCLEAVPDLAVQLRRSQC